MKGQCKFCLKPISEKNSLEHFLSCSSRIELFETFKQKLINKWFYIKAESSTYWMELLVPKKSWLDNLDHCLRSVWLECCGHLSHFHIENIRYERFENKSWLFEGEELSPGMKIELSKVLKVGSVFSHVYDYGSTTELQLTVLEELQFPVRKQSFLCAQNLLPILECANCKNGATRICAICQDFSCKKCANSNTNTNDNECEHIFSPLVNSPRTGICAYGTTKTEI